MAVKGNVIPTFIGSPRSARREGRYIPSGQGEQLQQAGKQITRAASTAIDGVNTLTRLLDERNSAAFARGYAEAEEEAARRVQEEVRSRTGFDAEGAAARTEQIYKEVGEKYRPLMKGDYRDRFDITWGKLASSQYRVSSDFEVRSLRQATATATESSLNANIRRAGDSMDEEFQSQNFDDLKENYDRLYFLRNGGKRSPREVLAELEKDITAGTLKTRDGKNLKVTDKEEGEGSISKARAEEIRKRWKVRAEAYEKGLTDCFDLAHSGVIDRLIKEDRTTEAREYMSRITAKGYPLSEKTRSKINAFIDNAEKVLADNALSDSIVKDAASEGGEPRYGSAEQDAAYAKQLERAEGNSEAINLAKRKYVELRRLQALNLQADAVRYASENFWVETPNGQKVPKSLSERGRLIGKMPEGPLKEYFKKGYEKELRAYDNLTRNTPAFQLESAQGLSRFKEDVRRGFYLGGRDGKQEIPLRSNEQIADYLNNMGLSQEDKKRAVDFISDRKNAVSLKEISDAYLAAMGGTALTKRAVEQYIPLLQRMVEDRRNSEGLGTKSERTRWIREQVNDLLKLQVERDTFFGWENDALGEKMGRDNDLTGVYFETSLLEKLYDAQDAARGRTSGALPRTKEERARSLRPVLGVETKNRRYFLNPGNEGR
jgi:hypothetical protein